MLGALKSLSPGVLPSNSAIDQVIRDNKYEFRQSNTKRISQGKLIALREYALELWQNNQHEIISYSTNNDSNPSSVLVHDGPKYSMFQVMPYLFIDLEEEQNKRVKGFYPSLHHTSGPVPDDGEIITIGEHEFRFNGTNYAVSFIPLEPDGDLELIRSGEVRVLKEWQIIKNILFQYLD